MNMTKKIYISILLALLLVGCGGGATSVSTEIDSLLPNTSTDQADTSEPSTSDNSTGSDFISPSDINLTKAIQDGYITGYDVNGPIEDQYMAVVNYLRSMSITCSDGAAVSGPTDAIVWDTLLADASKEHSDDMNTSGVYSHDGSGTLSDITGQTFTPTRSSTPRERVTRSGYAGQAGENIAIHVRYYANSGGQPTNFVPIDNDTWLTIMEKWMTSTTGHCSNLMNPLNKSFGMHETGSRVDDNGTHILHSTYWTLEFGNQ